MEPLFQDPRKPYAEPDGSLMLQIGAVLPEIVPVGLYGPDAKPVVFEQIPRQDYLARIQTACSEDGPRYTVRFYADAGFDAAILAALDQVQSLVLDPYGEIANPEAVGRLPKLRRLRLAAHGKPSADLLHLMGAQRLEEFTLAGTSKPLLDLSPLGDAPGLRVLRLLGQGRNIEAVGLSRSIIDLSLEPTEKMPLEFVNGLRQLEGLKLSVGKRRSLQAIGPLPQLRDLSVHWVHTLYDLGDLQRFPNLRRLQIELQKQLKRIAVGPANAALAHIHVEGIDAIDGFDELPALISYYNFAGGFAADWSKLPATLTHYAVPPASLRKREQHFADVRAHGFNLEPHPDARFFYK